MFTLQDSELSQAVANDGDPKQTVFSSGRWITDENVAYIRIPGFGAPDYEDSAIEWVNKFADAKVLIVDVRNNRGGNTPLELVKKLQNGPFMFWSETTPMNVGSNLARGGRGLLNMSVASMHTSGVSFRIGTVRTYLPGERPFEGVGIEPDFYVAVSRDDFYEKRDPMIAKAIELANE